MSIFSLYFYFLFSLFSPFSFSFFLSTSPSLSDQRISLSLSLFIPLQTIQLSFEKDLYGDDIRRLCSMYGAIESHEGERVYRNTASVIVSGVKNAEQVATEATKKSNGKATVKVSSMEDEITDGSEFEVSLSEDTEQSELLSFFAGSGGEVVTHDGPVVYYKSNAKVTFRRKEQAHVAAANLNGSDFEGTTLTAQL